MHSPQAVHNVIYSTLVNLQIVKSGKADETLIQSVSDEIAEAFNSLKDVDWGPFAIAMQGMGYKTVTCKGMIGIDDEQFECSSVHQLAYWLIQMNVLAMMGEVIATRIDCDCSATGGECQRGVKEAELLPLLETEFAFTESPKDQWVGLSTLTSHIKRDRSTFCRWAKGLPSNVKRKKGSSWELLYPQVLNHWSTGWDKPAI